jgi:hypothetical protein
MQEVPFVIYADFEAFVKKVTGLLQLASRIEMAQHIPERNRTIEIKQRCHYPIYLDSNNVSYRQTINLTVKKLTRTKRTNNIRKLKTVHRSEHIPSGFGYKVVVVEPIISCYAQLWT